MKTARTTPALAPAAALWTILGLSAVPARAEDRPATDGVPGVEPAAAPEEAGAAPAEEAAPAPPAPAKSTEEAAPAPDAGHQDLDAEAAKLAADLLNQSGAREGDGPEVFSPALRFYGFADYTIQKYIFLSDAWNGTLNDKLSFGVSHVNLYAEADVAPSWKSLIEVRFLFQPDGAGTYSTTAGVLNPLDTSGRTNTGTSDFYDSNRSVSLGGIAIQRAYIEYGISPYLKMRAGHFLTPWGVWNVDHGSPVIIGPSKPYIIGEQFFPESQTGFEVLGTAPVGDATLGYHLTLSNGRGPAQVLEDLDGNKAIGGRVFLRGYWLGQLDLGISGYGGTVTDRRQQVIDLTNQREGWFDYSRYNEISWAVDLRWVWRGLHFQNEAAFQDRVWDDNARPPGVNGVGYQPDVRRLGFYSLLGYRLPWLNLMPYALYGYYDSGLKSTFIGAHRVMAFSGGLNMRVTPTVVLKTEVAFGKFLAADPGSLPASGMVNLWSTQIAWAF